MNADGRTTRTDTLTRLATGLTVAGLSGVAGAISFSHMSTLAAEHGQLGWKATAFPISVDGLELVASLFILTQHRAGRRAGILPWLALVVGTAASLAANIAVGGDDTVGRALAGWPAVSLLVSIKLLFGMFDRPAVPDHPAVVPDQQRPSAGTAASSRTVPVPNEEDPLRAGTIPGSSVAGGLSSRIDGALSTANSQDRTGSEPGAATEEPAVAGLLPAARAARVALADQGQPLSREALATRMRTDGCAVSNARVSALLKILRSEPAFESAA